jgi:hypothetical protein
MLLLLPTIPPSADFFSSMRKPDGFMLLPERAPLPYLGLVVSFVRGPGCRAYLVLPYLLHLATHLQLRPSTGFGKRPSVLNGRLRQEINQSKRPSLGLRTSTYEGIHKAGLATTVSILVFSGNPDEVNYDMASPF